MFFVLVFIFSKSQVCSTCPADATFESMLPTYTYGYTFFLIPFPVNTDTYTIRVLAPESDTEISMGKQENTDIISAGWREYALTGYECITTSKPVMISQFVNANSSSSNGYPSFAIVPPREQWQMAYPIIPPYTLDGTQTFKIYALIASNSGSENRIQLNNKDLTADWTYFECVDGNAAGVREPLPNIRHHLLESTSRDNLGLIVYGVANYSLTTGERRSCGFTYTGGMCLDDLTVITFNI